MSSQSSLPTTLAPELWNKILPGINDPSTRFSPLSIYWLNCLSARETIEILLQHKRHLLDWSKEDSKSFKRQRKRTDEGDSEDEDEDEDDGEFDDYVQDSNSESDEEFELNHYRADIYISNVEIRQEKELSKGNKRATAWNPVNVFIYFDEGDDDKDESVKGNKFDHVFLKASQLQKLALLEKVGLYKFDPAIFPFLQIWSNYKIPSRLTVLSFPLTFDDACFLSSAASGKLDYYNPSDPFLQAGAGSDLAEVEKVMDKASQWIQFMLSLQNSEDPIICKSTYGRMRRNFLQASRVQYGLSYKSLLLFSQTQLSPSSFKVSSLTMYLFDYGFDYERTSPEGQVSVSLLSNLFDLAQIGTFELKLNGGLKSIGPERVLAQSLEKVQWMTLVVPNFNVDEFFNNLNHNIKRISMVINVECYGAKGSEERLKRDKMIKSKAVQQRTCTLVHPDGKHERHFMY
ncbi:uncharacterized protein LODBEIA_P50730 [Lodderomyces beijingensis]|uniref:Uncharacterized protein n=1 Tax=Lodderomyces beijingensis TaxID=1775926 RepID=A0ABP0ZSG0_9ASCO